MYYVYSLQCQDGYYVGCTGDLHKRLARHKHKEISSTKHRGPVSLDFYVACKNKYVAFRLEKYFKSGSGRAFVKKHFTK